MFREGRFFIGGRGGGRGGKGGGLGLFGCKAIQEHASPGNFEIWAPWMAENALEILQIVCFLNLKAWPCPNFQGLKITRPPKSPGNEVEPWLWIYLAPTSFLDHSRIYSLVIAICWADQSFNHRIVSNLLLATRVLCYSPLYSYNTWHFFWKGDTVPSERTQVPHLTLTNLTNWRNSFWGQLGRATLTRLLLLTPWKTRLGKFLLRSPTRSPVQVRQKTQ